LIEARRDVRVEPARLGVRRDRLLKEPAVAAGVHQPGKELWIVAVTFGFTDETDQRVLRIARVRFQVGVELVVNGQWRTQRQRAPEGVLGPAFAVARGVYGFSNDAVTSPELRPRGSKVR